MWEMKGGIVRTLLWCISKIASSFQTRSMNTLKPEMPFGSHVSLSFRFVSICKLVRTEEEEGSEEITIALLNALPRQNSTFVPRPGVFQALESRKWQPTMAWASRLKGHSQNARACTNSEL
jgi:hypothetical protein